MPRAGGGGVTVVTPGEVKDQEKERNGEEKKTVWNVLDKTHATRAAVVILPLYIMAAMQGVQQVK